jgi:predicted alpha/beta hydrolase family esterase
MVTLILPGFSKHGEKWIAYLESNLKVDHKVKSVKWEHWKAGGGIKLKKELEKIERIIGKDKFNIIAKSVGTMVCLNVIKFYPTKVNKIIFCGIPSVGEKRLELMKESLGKIKSENLLFVQNTFDPFVKSKDLQETLKEINKDFKVTQKEAKNHDYYYVEDFNKFLMR